MLRLFALIFALSVGVAQAQVTPGTSPLTIPKGGTGGATASAARNNLIPSNTLTNSQLSQMPANTVKCNPTGSLANVQDCTSVGLAVGGLGGSQAAATANQVPVFPGSGGAATPTTIGGAGGFFDTVCSSTIGQAWVRLTGGWGCLSLGWSNPVWWGADPTGVADSTSSINSAAAANANVFFPPGTFKTTAAIVPPINSHWVGAGEALTTLQTNSATLNILTISNPFNAIEHIGFSASVTRSGGWFIDIGASQFWMRNFLMSAPFEGIRIQDAISIINIFDGTINNAVAASGIGIRIGSGTATGPVAISIRGVIASAAAGAKPFAELALINVGDVALIDNQFLAGLCGIYEAPGTGQAVVSVKMIGGFSDSGGTALCIQPSGSGTVARSSYNAAWLSQSGNSNVIIAPSGTATVDGIDFTGSEIYGGTNGFTITQAAGTTVKNISINGNRIAGASASAININGLTNGIISNNVIGSSGGFGVNATGLTLAGTVGRLLIENNDLTGSTAKIANTMTSSLSRTEGNLGFNPVGTTTPTVGASPWTYTASASRETLYVFGGTISAIAINGTTLFSSAGGPWVIPLEPNDTMTVTYSAAPTVNVQRH